ncbi:MAG: hypothetical protein A2516_06455 [Alphaproteobacteria bacterium RIFOXYD12_FULL_60_8]|nr:MAG: hypothetical protein A2516_06455 [Alphaproteobacteria bacterium RIFOXYD12_FULL_60_8]
MTKDQREIDSYLMLADISGYTNFISFNRQEIAHAQHIISALIEAVLDAAAPPLEVNKLEGDAVFLHAEEGPDAAVRVAHSALDFFTAFDAARRHLMITNSCPCRACADMGKLDLKVLVHHGRVLVYRVRLFEELSGFDVVLAHRLLKNSVDSRRYLLVSKPAWDRLMMTSPVESENHREVYEGVGEVETVVLRIPPDPSLPPPVVAPARGVTRWKDIFAKHAAEFLFPLGLRKAPTWGDQHD